jgi:Collagen triple helix repeat (20 copies)
MGVRRIRLLRLLIGVAVAALGLLAVSLVAIAAPGPSAPPVSAGSAAGAEAKLSGKAQRRQSLRGRRGPRGKRGPQGQRGEVGAQGPIGPQGPQGQQGSPIIRQPISIDWQNNDWQGHATQEFVAPGIGTGNVTCKPPYDNGPTNREPGGTQWVQLFPYDSNGSVAETVMWTTRFGGAQGHSDESVVRTAKLLNSDYGPSFYEGMNTQSGQSVDPESQGMFVGIISSRTKSTGGDLAHPTTFVLSWHWHFANLGEGGSGENRCYVTGNFYTGR